MSVSLESHICRNGQLNGVQARLVRIPLQKPSLDPWGNTRIGLTGTTKINRKDFGLTWNAVLETGGILVGDDGTITLDVQFIKA
jgi:polyisoprenoid-binding protein YceI